MKVTHGRVPLTGVFPLAPSLDTVGPLTRDVADAALVYMTIAGYDASDPWASPRQPAAPRGPLDINQVTLGVPHPWVDLAQTDEVAAAFAAARQSLLAAGATLVDLDLPDYVPARELEHSVYPEVAVVHNERWHQDPDSYGPDVSERLGEVFDIDPLSYVRAHEWRARIRHSAEAALAQCDFLITPSVAANAKPIGEELISVGDKLVSYRPQLSRYSALINHTGLPAIAVPLDMPGVPPPSLQIIGRAWDEAGLLDIAAALEQDGISRYRRPPLVFD